MPSTVVRVAVALSGGVDSAVVALLLKRCAPQWRDIEALCSLNSPLSLGDLQKTLEQRRSWSDVLPTPSNMMRRGLHDLAASVHYVPVFMKNWEDAVEVRDSRRGWCETAQRDYNDAIEVARSIGLLRSGEMMPLHNYSACYIETCFEPMLDAYARGATLNVDILCNSEVKFHALLNTLIDSDKAHYIATGHYARTALFQCDDNDKSKVQVIARPFSAGRDLNDQTVFLSRLSTQQTSKALFPLGHVFEQKADVRAVAAYFGLTPVCKKKTSTGICFVGEHYKRKSHNNNNGDGDNDKNIHPGGGFSSFLEEYIAPNNESLERIVADGGKTTFVNAETGNEVDASKLLLCGGHNKSVFPAYSVTLGQLIRGKDNNGRGVRYYVQNKELFSLQECNGEKEVDCLRFLRTVWLVDRWDHPLLYKSVAELKDVALSLHPRFLGKYGEEIRLCCLCCTRHQEPLRQATLCFALRDVHETNDGIRVSYATVVFDTPVRALTPGQALVAYWPLNKCDVDGAASLFVLASGWITETTGNPVV